MLAGSPCPQKVVVAGAVIVFEASVEVTVTTCSAVKVLEHVTAEIFIALTVSVAFPERAVEVREIVPPVPTIADPEVVVPL
jgi:hypothetical protein